LSNSLGVQKNVRFVGAVEHSNVPSILAKADVGLLPLRDTMHDRCKCPIKLYEYMAMELPIVSVDFGESAYVIRDVGCGVTSRNDPDSFAGAMDQVSENLDYWHAMGKKGREYLTDHQNWDILSDKLEQVLMSMIGER
jgi:glycosyltransferase involved in cell wall biosynthesis